MQVVNLMGPLDEDEARNPNAIKVVCDRHGDALYFSRQPIPSGAGRGAHLLKQVCIIPFRRAFLTTFAALEPTPLERIESIDMLRAIEHGYRVRMVRTAHATRSVDTPGDLVAVSVLMAADGRAADGRAADAGARTRRSGVIHYAVIRDYMIDDALERERAGRTRWRRRSCTDTLEAAGSAVAAVEFVKPRAGLPHRVFNFDMIAPLL